MRTAPPAAFTVVAVLLCGAAQGQPPDWTGRYTELRGRSLGALKQVSPNLGEVITAHLQPWARAKMEATDGVADDTGAICEPDGFFRYSVNGQGPGSFLWLPAADKIVLIFAQINTAGVRRIYLNRKHPSHLLPTWNGDSIGHWEGETLVVDTIGFNDKSWLHPAMQPHTEETHMIERLRTVPDAGSSVLEMAATVEDRQALTAAYTFTRYFRKSGESLPENICNDDIEIWKDFRNKALNRHLQSAHEVHP
jgi:hypothetical protein